MADWLFSNRHRFLKICVSITIVATLLWWGVRQAIEYDVRFEEMVANPQDYAGRKVFIGGRIVAKDSERITLIDRGEEVHLSFFNRPEIAEIPLRSVVTGEGVFTDGKVIEVTKYQYQQYRDLKVWLSLMITPIMFLVFLRKFGWVWEKGEFVERGGESH